MRLRCSGLWGSTRRASTIDLDVGGSREEPAQAGKAALLNPTTANPTSQGVVFFIIIYRNEGQGNNIRQLTDSSIKAQNQESISMLVLLLAPSIQPMPPQDYLNQGSVDHKDVSSYGLGPHPQPLSQGREGSRKSFKVPLPAWERDLG